MRVVDSEFTKVEILLINGVDTERPLGQVIMTAEPDLTPEQWRHMLEEIARMYRDSNVKIAELTETS